ncbi:MAG: co-chaperone GroES [Chloroflexota bacterium]
MAAKIQPLSDGVLVRPTAKEEVSKGGILLPDSAREKPQEGEILAVGPGRVSEDGKRIPIEVAVGDVVIYSKYGGTEVKVDEEELIILHESDLIAKRVK